MADLANNISSKWKAYLAFACVAFFWGTTFLAIKIGVESFPPFLFAGIRQLLAGIILCAPFIFKRANWPDLSTVKKSLIAGTLMIVIGNGAVTWSEKYISSGLAAILCSFTPFWIVGFNALTDKNEKISARIFTGMCIALAGVIFIFFDNLKDLTNPSYLFGILAVVLANASWGAGTIYTKKNKSDLNPLYAAGLQLFLSGILLNLISFGFEAPYNFKIETDALLALLYLIIFGSVLAYGAYLYALAALPTHIVTTYAYINPVVAVILGWVFLDESLNLWIISGFVMVLIGVYIVNTLNYKDRAQKAIKNTTGKEEPSEKIEIVDYNPSYFEDFKAMNIAWISKLFVIEDVDKQVIEHPEEFLLKGGGHILMATYKGKAVGTCSLKNKGKGVYELTKMTVDENYRGLRIGRILGEATIEKARNFEAKKIELYSNRAGAAVAIELYKKLGFIEVPLDTKEYQRADIKMEMDL